MKLLTVFTVEVFISMKTAPMTIISFSLIMLLELFWITCVLSMNVYKGQCTSILTFIFSPGRPGSILALIQIKGNSVRKWEVGAIKVAKFQSAIPTDLDIVTSTCVVATLDFSASC